MRRAWVRTATKSGDTLGSLSARYGVPKEAILRQNNVPPAAEQPADYTARRARELQLPPTMPAAAARKVVQEDDISVWVSDKNGKAVELQPGAAADIRRFADCPAGQYAIFSADSVIYLPECTVKEATLPLINVQPSAPAAPATIGGPMTGIAQALARQRPRAMGNYVLGSVPADAKTFDSTNVGDVLEVQQALNDVWGASKIAFREGPGPALGLATDGAYGPNSRKAVSLFQAANGLPANGVLDRATSLKLQDDDAHEIGTAPPKLPLPSSGPSTLMIVGGLAAVGAVVAIGAVVAKKRAKKNPRRKRLRGRRRRR